MMTDQADMTLETVSRHEAGHAVVDAAHGSKVLSLELRFSGGFWRGMTTCDPAAIVRAGLRAVLAGGAAGHVAHAAALGVDPAACSARRTSSHHDLMKCRLVADLASGQCEIPPPLSHPLLSMALPLWRAEAAATVTGRPRDEVAGLLIVRALDDAKAILGRPEGYELVEKVAAATRAAVDYRLGEEDLARLLDPADLRLAALRRAVADLRSPGGPTP